VGGSDKSRLAL